MHRALAPERVDRPAADPELLSESLSDLAWMNRYLGVAAGIVRQLHRLIGDQRARRLSVLDVGAGGGDILAAVERWCGRRGIGCDGWALDSGRATASIAATRLAEWVEGGRVQVVRADARSLPFGDRSVDVSISSTFLHHMEEDDAARVLREMARVSRIGIVVTDLRRGRAGYLAAWTLANTVWRGHDYTHHDAPASMRAAFTIAEVRELAERAGLAARIGPQLWFRWALRWSRQR